MHLKRNFIYVRTWLLHVMVYNFMYRVFIKYCVLALNDVIFLDSASCAAALVFDLPLCTHTDTERGQSPDYILESSKTTIFDEHPECIFPRSPRCNNL